MATAAAPPDAVTERALQLVLLLRPRGAALQTGNPTVRSWAERGITDVQALQALEIAQQRRHDAADPSAINAGYLDAILRDVTTTQQRPPSAPRNRDEGRSLASGTSLAEALAATQHHGGSNDVQRIEAPAP